MPRFYSLLIVLVGSALVLLSEVTPAFSQFEKSPNIIRDWQRQEKISLPDQPIQNSQPQQLRPIPRAAPADQIPAVALQPKSYSLRLFEIEGQLQFHRFTTGFNLAHKPHELQLSDEQEARIVEHYVEQCKSLCEERLSVCELDPLQIVKLQGAAVVDATRFVRNLRAKFAGTWEEQQARKLDPVSLRGELNSELVLGIRNPNSLFRKIFITVLTPAQRVLLFRSKATSLLDAIDNIQDFSQKVSEGALRIDDPRPGAQAESFVRLKPEQRERLFILIIESNDDESDLWELVTQPHTVNLLRFITREELAEFLTTPQVEAVLLQKTSVDKAHALLQTLRPNADAAKLKISP